MSGEAVGALHVQGVTATATVTTPSKKFQFQVQTKCVPGYDSLMHLHAEVCMPCAHLNPCSASLFPPRGACQVFDLRDQLLSYKLGHGLFQCLVRCGDRHLWTTR